MLNLKGKVHGVEIRVQFEPLFQLPPTFFHKYKQHMFLKINLMQSVGVFFGEDEILVKL